MDEDKDKISDAEMKKIEDFLKKTANKKVNLRKKQKNLSLKEKQQLAISINNKIIEHMDSYILLGFDTHGNDVILVNSANELENRALRNLVEDFLTPYDMSENASFEDDESEEDF
jgi:hypothetical protein